MKVYGQMHRVTSQSEKSGKHAPARARIIASERVASVINCLTSEELCKLDDAFVRISINRYAGEVVGHSELYDYRNGSVRVIYHLTHRGTVVVAYAEA